VDLHQSCGFSLTSQGGQLVQYQVLIKLLPNLCPRILPRHLLDHDFRKLLQQCPPVTSEAFQSALAVFAQRPSSSECHTCGLKGEPQVTISHSSDDDGAVQLDAETSKRGRTKNGTTHPSASSVALPKLHFTTRWHLNFGECLCEMLPPSFCCAKCRACLDMGSVIQLASLRAGGSHGDQGCVRFSHLLV
jgi:hypothetical protein